MMKGVLMKEYYPRIVDGILKDQLEASGAVLIEGTKWCGKSTTAEMASNSSIKMDDPDDGDRYLKLAQLQVSSLLAGDTPRLIDEWQIAPNIWNAVRHEVDKRGEFGQFILTGSSVPSKLDKTMHSGTGRFSRIKMRPMSLFESKDSNGSVSLKDLFENKKPSGSENPCTLENLAYLVCRGGWPLAIGQSEKVALLQARNYYDSVIEEDIIRSEEDEKLDPERAKRVLRAYARNIAQGVSIEKIRNDVIDNDDKSFSQVTLYNYLKFLNRIFLLDDSSAWNPNLRSKVAIRTTDTRYFVDPSIGAAALGIGPSDLVNDLETFGFFFENMCVRDLKVYAESLDGQIYHYRDGNGLECDAVLHLRNGSYGLIEIKLGSDKAIEEGAKNLLKFDNILDTSKMKKPSFKMILVGKGNYAYRREDGIDIVPITCLKP